MRTTKMIGASLVAAAALTTLVACSSDSAETATSAIAAASDAADAAEAADAAAAGGGTPEMQALCAQMVAEALSPDAATALATENGYVARVGTLEGEAQAVTMDLREDRFTFEVTGGVVVACTYG
jgi:hypothetical protein